MTFKQFVSTRRGADNPRGDFIKDVKRDKDFPDCVERQRIRGYLASRLACDAAMKEFENLYKQYERSCKGDD